MKTERLLIMKGNQRHSRPPSGTPWAHRRVGEVEKEAAGRLLAIAILRKEGGTDMNPKPTTTLLPGDALVVIKRGGR